MLLEEWSTDQSADVKKILIINGSASHDSSNHKLIQHFVNVIGSVFHVSLFPDLKKLPHFEPMLSQTNTPKVILDFRHQVATADGILICTPEYIHSIPSGLKNAFEWCVATTVFSDKCTGMITASANGEKGHQELEDILRTIGARLTTDTMLLIRGIRSKINEKGTIIDTATEQQLQQFAEALTRLING